MSFASLTAVFEGVYMYNFEFIKDGKKWHRVDKRVARKTFNAGGWVRLYPSRVCPSSVWVGSVDIRYKYSCGNFDAIINEFEYYNCNSEVGNSVNYFIEK